MNVGALVKTAMAAVPSDLKAAVTFTLTTPGTHDESTGRFSAPTSSSVSGYASEEEGDTKQYRDLALIESHATTLIFVPNTMGQLPALHSTCTWGGGAQTVRAVESIAPAGTAFAARVVISR